MTYENLVKAAKKAVKPVDASIIKEHIAVEFDIEGKGEGAFYVEFSAKEVVVEPYEYYDHDFRIRCAADVAIAILSGEISPVKASEEAKIVVEGNAGRLALLEEYLKAEVKTKKTTAKKTAAKKETAKKETIKKETVKKETVKKETAVKAEKKPVDKAAAKAEAKPAAKPAAKTAAKSATKATK